MSIRAESSRDRGMASGRLPCAFRLRPLCALIALGLPAALLGPGPAAAGPTGEAVVAGAARVARPDAATTRIDQASDRAVINWNRFDIGASELVRFNQPSSSAVVLNRVLSADPSQIFGQLQANGRLVLLNPAGIVFGAGARVDVGSMLATTLDFSNEDFLSGRLRLRGSQTSGSVVNRGALRAADGGSIGLIAPQVVNTGTVVAPNGQILLSASAGGLLDLHGDGLLAYRVDTAAAGARLANSGELHADGGSVSLEARATNALLDTVIDTSGVVSARTIGSREGRIYLDGGASGRVAVSGSVDASGGRSTETGGQIRLSGDDIRIGTAAIDASGPAGGGQVLVGGGYQGQGPQRGANATRLAAESSIRADATERGSGGSIVVWSDATTAVQGTLSARGGPAGGNGGMIETSGRTLNVTGLRADASAAAGLPGQWLIDPSDIRIVNVSPSPYGEIDIGGDPNWVGTGSLSILRAGQISNTLSAGTNVSVQTSSSANIYGYGDIFVEGDILKNGGGDARLTLQAGRDIVMSAGSIRSSVGKLDVQMLAAGSSLDRLGNAIQTSSPGVITVSGPVDTNGGQLRLVARDSVTVDGAVKAAATLLDTSNGPVRITASNNLAMGLGDVRIATPGNASISASGAGSQIAMNSLVVNGSTDIMAFSGADVRTGPIDATGMKGDLALSSFDASTLVTGPITATGVTQGNGNGGIRIFASGSSHIDTGRIDADAYGPISISAFGDARISAVAGGSPHSLISQSAVSISAMGPLTSGGVGQGGQIDLGNASVTLQVPSGGVGEIGAGGFATGSPVDNSTNGKVVSLRSSGSTAQINGDLRLQASGGLIAVQADNGGLVKGNLDITHSGGPGGTGTVAVDARLPSFGAAFTQVFRSAISGNGVVAVQAWDGGTVQGSLVVDMRAGNGAPGGSLGTGNGTLSGSGIVALQAWNGGVADLSSTVTSQGDIVAARSWNGGRLNCFVCSISAPGGQVEIGGFQPIGATAGIATFPAPSAIGVGVGPVAGTGLAVLSADRINFGTARVIGGLSTASSGPVTQSGPLAVSDRSSLDAGGSSISLTDSGNRFTGPVTLKGGVASLRDADALTAALNVTGGATLLAGGPLTVSGSAGTLATTTGGSVGTTTFGPTSVSGDLNVSSAGAVTQTAGLAVGGLTVVRAFSGDITLLPPAGAASRFGGAVSLGGYGSLAIEATQGDLALSPFGLPIGPDASFKAAASGPGANLDLTRLGGQWPALQDRGRGDYWVQAGSGGRVLWASTPSIRGRNVTVISPAALALQGPIAASGDLRLSSGGLTQAPAAAITVGGATLVDGAGAAAPTAQLDQGVGSFAGPVTIDGTTASVRASGPLSVVLRNAGVTALQSSGDLTASGSGTADLTTVSGGATRLGALALGAGRLDVTSAGAVSQAGSLVVGGPATVRFSGAPQDVALADAGNDFRSLVSVDGADVSVADRDALAFTGSARTLSLQSGGDLALRGASATGATTIVSGGRVTLANGTPWTLGNAGGASSFVRAAGPIDLGSNTTVTVGGGALAMVSDHAPGAQSAPLSTLGTGPADSLLFEGRPVRQTASAIAQGAGSALVIDPGASVTFHATQGGSIDLSQPGNRLAGRIGARVDCAQSPCVPAPPAGGPATVSVVALQSQTGITTAGAAQTGYATGAGTQTYVFGGGLAADVIRIKAPGLATPDDTSAIAPRLQYSAADAQQAPQGGVLPSLAIEFAGQVDNPAFGTAGNAIAVDFGAVSDGRVPGVISVTPSDAARVPAGFTVFTRGAATTAPVYTGQGNPASVPVFYNGKDLRLLPAEPPQQITRERVEALFRDPAIVQTFASIGGIIEEARRRAFEELVRTENVASRLRRSVILRVGPGAGAWDNSADAIGINVQGLGCEQSLGLTCAPDKKP